MSLPSSFSTLLNVQTNRPTSSKRTERWDTRFFGAVSLRPPARILRKQLLSTIRRSIAHWRSPTESRLGYLRQAFAAHALWYLGYSDQALEAMHRALSIAAELNHP